MGFTRTIVIVFDHPLKMDMIGLFDPPPQALISRYKHSFYPINQPTGVSTLVAGTPGFPALNQHKEENRYNTQEATEQLGNAPARPRSSCVYAFCA